MAKAVSLTAEALEAPQITPSAATPPRREAKAKKPDPKEQVPLQVRLPRDQVRAIKVAAAERDLTISDFMLACFHAHMKAAKHA
jgi:NRPS condensation-like uncharacterized protein